MPDNEVEELRQDIMAARPSTCLGDCCWRIANIPAEIKKLVAEAWDAGYKAAIEEYGCDIPWGGFTSNDNPWRTTP